MLDNKPKTEPLRQPQGPKPVYTESGYLDPIDREEHRPGLDSWDDEEYE